MPAIGTTKLPGLTAALAEVGAELTAFEVHALFLGVMTSTTPRFGPQHFIERILGESDRDEPSMRQIAAILGYWNHLQDEQAAGRTRLVAMDLSDEPTREELRAYIDRRTGEVHWYLQGFSTGGDDAYPLGHAAKAILRRLTEALGYFKGTSRLLDREPFTDAKALKAARENLVMLTGVVESLIADLIAEADATRRQALVNPAAADAYEPSVRVPTHRGPKIGRNEPCPCGSGKKWKRCCGNLAIAQ